MRRAILPVFVILLAIPLQARPRLNQHHVRHAATPVLTIDVSAVNNPATQPQLAAHARGTAVLRAQVLLDRAHFSVGEIDGLFGRTMEDTVRAYQSVHGLQADGVLNADVWQALDVDTAPIVTPYTITPQDTAGPFEKTPQSIEAQSKLPFLGYGSPEEELGERFHSSPTLLKVLNPRADFRKPGEQILVPNVQRAPVAEEAAFLLVKKNCNCVEVLDAENRLIAHYPATMGSAHDPLPLGDWKTGKPLLNPLFHYNPKLFWDAKATNPRRTLKPGPNNPAGLAWIPISKEHYGIHGTPAPADIGKKQSHGCIRLTNWDVSELAGMVRPGMRARLRES